MQLELDIRRSEDGQAYLHFPFMSISDIHLLTSRARAKALCRLLQNTQTKHLQLPGDIIDGEYAMEKDVWNIGPYQRQVIGHFLRKAENGTKVVFNEGNHEIDFPSEAPNLNGELKPHRSLAGKSLFNVAFENASQYTDPKGRNILIDHGHRHDGELFKTAKSQRIWYRRGGKLLELAYKVDAGLQYTGLEWSFAAWSKRRVKRVINKYFGIEERVTKAIDESPYDGYLYGHSHMGGFHKTPQNKLLINDGTCTEHVQAVVHDQHGTFALLEWHKNYLHIEDEHGARKTMRWTQLGLQDFSADPETYEDESLEKTDRLLRLISKMWPSQERQRQVQGRRKSNKQGVPAKTAPEIV